MTRITDRTRRKRWQRFSNAELARRKWALNPDEPHPFAARRITNALSLGTPLSRTEFIRSRWRQVPSPRPCRICGGSEQLIIHWEGLR